jgi:hypothetical protein
MNQSRRRRGRRRPAASQPPGSEATGTTAPVQPQRGRQGLVQWNWRTFPVFFAASAGLVFGGYIGALAQVAGNTSATIILTGLALPFAFGLSRVFNRYVLFGRLIKPRPPRSRK